MKKTFINPEMEVLRFQKGADVLLTSGPNVMPGDGSSGYADGKYGGGLVRGKNYDDDDF